MRQERDNLYLQYYQPATKVTHWFGGPTFDIRFQEIKNSLVDMGIFRTIWNLICWKLGHTNEGVPKDEADLERVLPIQRPLFKTKSNTIEYTWIGHSTAVISFGQKANFLIDPVFSLRSSPYQWIGPKRFRLPACTIDDLPRIDCVLVSHDHYDHLDEHSLNQIHRRFRGATFVAGLNSHDVFPRGCKFIQLDWTQKQSLTISGDVFEITFVPACHWSRRGLFDKNKRLWGGFVIEEMKTRKKVFYSGDTGYCGVFQEIGQIFGPFDLAILPIGAYLPREYLKNQHVNPEQAVRVHKQLKSKKSVGVHWGTFPLGYEHYTAARTDLKEAVEKNGLKEDQFVTVDHGGSLTIY